MTCATVAALNVYPVKSCRGTVLERGTLGPAGFVGDRRWMVVNEAGRFQTQRELPRLALIVPAARENGLRLNAPDMPELAVSDKTTGKQVEVTIWNDRCAALDAGEEAAQWFSHFLGRPVRLVRFDPAGARPSNRQWTGDEEALNEFSDGFPLLIVSRASLDDLNTRLDARLPMNRFRPNIVLEGLQAYEEDRIHELANGEIRLRLVKPCTRCKITTIDQATGRVAGPEPLLALRKYRWSEALRGVTFAQNAIIVSGIGAEIHVGQPFEIVWKP